MSEPTKAVFLSYAREDADAARRIAEALRSHGIEVWFDQSELRGGDAWDQKIRRQIKECALFIAIISRHTHERTEGYFRLEWKLAVERTYMLREGVPFLVPVVVDRTPEDTDSVPMPFTLVQWTRLPEGLPTPEFVAEVQKLLEAPRRRTAQIPETGNRNPETAGLRTEDRLPAVGSAKVGGQRTQEGGPFRPGGRGIGLGPRLPGAVQYRSHGGAVG